MKLLLPTDGFPNAYAALEVVLARNWEPGTQARVISVLQPMQHVFGDAFTALTGLDKAAQKAYRKLEEHTQEILDRKTSQLAQKFGKDNVSSAIMEGKPKETIVEEARRWGADSIIMGAHGRSEPGEFIFGSVPEYVLTHAGCPVEILRRPTPATLVAEIQNDQPVEEDKYLIALDDSPFAEATLQVVLARKWHQNAQFKVISVVEPLPFQSYVGLGPWEGAGNEEFAELMSRTLTAEKSCAEEVVEKAVRRLKQKFPDARDVSGAVLDGFAKDKIISFAREWPADLIILGSHGRKGVAEFVLGSVSKATAMHAPCSVLVVHQRNTAGQPGSDSREHQHSHKA